MTHKHYVFTLKLFARLVKTNVLILGEGGRLKLMPNNKPTQSPSLIQSSPRVSAKSNTPSTRRIFMTKCMYYLVFIVLIGI